MSAYWTDFLTSAAIIAIVAAAILCPPLGTIFLAALLTYLAAGWIKDERKRKCPQSNRTKRQ